MGNTATDKVMVVDHDICTGCEVCEMTCSMNKHHEYNPKKSHIQVLKNWTLDMHVPVLDMGCDYCGKCVDWCPPGAIKTSPVEDPAQKCIASL